MKMIYRHSQEYPRDSKFVVEFDGDDMRLIGVDICAKSSYGSRYPTSNEEAMQFLLTVFQNNQTARRIVLNEASALPIIESHLEKLRDAMKQGAQLLTMAQVSPVTT